MRPQDLTKLDLRDNQFSKFPIEITTFKNLTHLNISFNLLKSIPPEIGELSNLTYLSLAGNEISFIPSQITKLKKLRYLDLCGNCLTEFPYRTHLPSLTHIDLSYNQIPTDELTQDLQIFISYSRKDTDVMKQVKTALKKAGFSLWTDEALTPGTFDWEVAIEENIAKSDALVVILSPDAKKSAWVRREISYAENNDKHIYPILWRGDVNSSIPISLIRYQFVDIRDNLDSGINRIVETITGQLDDDKAE